jgi:aminomethyltransferase
MSETAVRKTPLNAVHRRYGARLVPFAGWEMPVQYSGVIDEQRAVRTAAGLFDVSHMGELWVEGPDAQAALQYLTLNDVTRLYSGRIQYSAMANFEGGLVDDIVVYGFGPDRYLLCVNAANTAKDLRWIKAHLERFPQARVVDRSAETALIALQGPQSETILRRLTHADIPRLHYYHFIRGRVAGMEMVISRTGYTGEDGFELFVDASRAADLWEEIMTVGEPHNLLPCGLGARDVLRLEMGYLLYGQDIDETTNPLEAGLGWITALGKGDFIGSVPTLRLKEEGVSTLLAAFALDEAGVPRHGYPIFHGGRRVGTVTSGTHSPSLGKGIGLGYLPPAAAVPGTIIGIGVRDREVRATVTSAPFYRNGSIRKKNPE